MFIYYLVFIIMYLLLKSNACVLIPVTFLNKNNLFLYFMYVLYCVCYSV